MKVIKEGHVYQLAYLDGYPEHDYEENHLVFVNRLGEKPHHSGTTNQDVLRALIDRVKYLDNQLPWAGNEKILYHLRMALALHEVRALERKVEKGTLEPELVKCDVKDGHFSFIT